MNTIEFADQVRRLLSEDGYEVHRSREEENAELAGAYWFTWMKPGMASAETGPTVADEWSAWASALSHRLAESGIALDLMGTPCSAAIGPLPSGLPARQRLRHRRAGRALRCPEKRCARSGR